MHGELTEHRNSTVEGHVKRKFLVLPQPGSRETEKGGTRGEDTLF